MKRIWILSIVAVAMSLASASICEAQVYIRAPFVRVAVGDGVSVRAPFVNLFIPPSGPTYGPVYNPLYPPPITVNSPPPVANPPAPMPPADQIFVPPVPFPANPNPNLPVVRDANAPPVPVQAVQSPTLDSFAKTFTPKAGSYEIVLINPVTKLPTTVRFSLPEGTPRRVIVNRDSIEFVYNLRTWVRIEFDRDGVQVTSR